jgi:hypothetical protein
MNKVEVLESMEFFRIAWEYQFDHAEVPTSPISQHTTFLTHSSEPRKCNT